MKVSKDLENRAINTIRFLAADAVQKANSGHPGLPMGAAAMAYTFGHVTCDLILEIRNGLGGIVLSFQVDMALHYFMLYCI